jgi:hypothetical protein
VVYVLRFVRLFVQVVAMGQLAHHVFKTALGVVKLVGHCPSSWRTAIGSSLFSSGILNPAWEDISLKAASNIAREDFSPAISRSLLALVSSALTESGEHFGLTISRVA